LITPNAINVDAGAQFNKATGKNPNPFFHIDDIATPIVSEKATIAPLNIKETVLYDLPTIAGKTYTFVAL
jgi:alpha-L-fucosidase 2